MTARSGQCRKRERALQASARAARCREDGLCRYCELPVSTKKRAGFCSSEAVGGKPGRTCSRRMEKSISSRDQQQVSNEQAVMGYQLSLICSFLDQMDDPLMSAGTQRALFGDDSKSNVFITGPAGTGKTVDVLLACKRLLEHFKLEPCAVALTASTGAAAAAIGGSTFHSFFGLGGSGGVGAVYRWRAWRWLKVIVIDEISLLDEVAFAQASSLMKEAKGCSSPFGGVRVIVAGDFAQLPTVHPSGIRPDILFDQGSWLECNFQVVYLGNRRRCEDEDSWEVLQELRLHHPDFGLLSDRATALLSSLVVDQSASLKTVTEDGLCITHLYPRRNRTDEVLHPSCLVFIMVQCAKSLGKGITVNLVHSTQFNLSMLDKLAGDSVELSSHDSVKCLLDPLTQLPSVAEEVVVEVLNRAVLARPSLKLKVGAHVVLIANLKGIHPLLTKGVTGRVVHLSAAVQPTQIRVCFDFPNPHGHIVVDMSHEYEFTTLLRNGGLDLLCVRRAVPLLLAWALTIHASQGMTLPRVHVDLSGIFENGQGYVALSRTRSLRHVTLQGFDTQRISCSRRVLEYYNGERPKDPAVDVHLEGDIVASGERGTRAPHMRLNPPGEFDLGGST